MFRKLLAASALALAPLAFVAGPADALSPGQTVCYAADGTAVVNPPNPDDFESCFTRPSTGSGGPSGPQLCTITVYSSGYGISCTPIVPLQG